jgi:hypothetical protein
MKQHHSLTALMLTLLGCTAAQGSTVMQSDPQPGGIFYRWTVSMGLNDSASVSRHVGAWAWQDSSLFSSGETPVGWTHNSEWLAFTLQAPAMVTLRLANAAGVANPTSQNPDAIAPDNLYPGMTIYSGWDNDLASQAFSDANNDGAPTNDWHSYVNRGNIAWAEDTSYFIHLEPNGTHVVETTTFMPAGNYTMVIGGKSLSDTSEPRQGYLASFSTAPVPEPTAAALVLLGGLSLLGQRARHRRAR